MERIGLLGDTHSSVVAAVDAIERFHSQGITRILHVGDFGFWPGVPGAKFLASVNTHLSRREMTMYVTPGNHEDYTFLRALSVEEDGWQRARQNIFVAPRGHRWEWEGISFVSLGGAPSVDRSWRLGAQRKHGHPVWWAEEDITREDMEKTMLGGYADVMVAHDAPFGVPGVERGIAGNPHNFLEMDLRYAYEGRKKMQEVVDVVRPKLFFHGHYHFKVEDEIQTIDNTIVKVYGLAADGHPFSSGILEIPSLKFHFLR